MNKTLLDCPDQGSVVEEAAFGYKIKHALNEHVQSLPPAVIRRLSLARKGALQRKACSSSELALAYRVAGHHHTHPFFSEPHRINKVLSLLSLLLGLFALTSLIHTEQSKKLEVLADLDTAVLLDPLPPAAYLDHGFNAYLMSDEN